MQYPIIVRNESDNRFSAQPVGLPELKVVAANESEALSELTQALESWLATAKVVNLDIPITENPWLAASGRSADDPDFEELLEELKCMRRRDTEG